MKLLPNARCLVVATLAALAPLTAARAQDAPPEAETHAPRLPSLPTTPAERDKILSDLYDKLAHSEDARATKALELSIERVWMHSGSPTVDLLFARAMKAIAEDDYDLALRFLDHVVEQAPDFTEGWSRRAFVHFQRKEVGLALGDLRRALALDPSNFRALDGLAKVWRDIGRKRAALAAFRRLAQVHPNWPGTDRAIEELSRDVEGQGI